MNAIDYNHNFKILNIDEIPNTIKELHDKRVGYFDYIKYCNKCGIVFMFIIIDDDDGTIDTDNCYFYIDNNEIFYYFNSLKELNLTCEETIIKLLLE